MGGLTGLWAPFKRINICSLLLDGLWLSRRSFGQNTDGPPALNRWITKRQPGLPLRRDEGQSQV